MQQGHLVRLDLSTSQLTPLTGGKSTEWFPVCSPIGDQILYWSNANGGIYNLWKINLDGSQRTQLTYDETDSLQTSDQNLLVNDAANWSSDGKEILYALNGDIWDMGSDGFNPETLLISHSAVCPVFSPDNKSVLFVTNQNDTVYNLWIYNISDQSLSKLTNYTDWNVGSPSYSTDGKKILFNLYRDNVTQIYVTDADGENPVNLTTNNQSLCPRFCQNDQKIVFCSYGSDADQGLNVFMESTTGSDMVSLTTGGGTSPSWAPSRILTSVPTPIGK